MAWPSTFCDDEALVRDWVNASTVVGAAGGPLARGAHLQRLRSAAPGAFAVLSALPGDDDSPSDVNLHLARVSAHVYGPSKADAKTAALAYANLLQTARGLPVALTGAVLHVVEDVTSPYWLPDVDEPRFIVDATFVFRPS